MNPMPALVRTLAWALVPWALLAAPPARVHPGQPPAGPVAGAMEVAVLGGEIKVTLTLVNHSARVVWLERLEEGGAPMRPEFEVRSEDGRLVPYLGPMAKRQAFGKGDFFPLEPGRTSRREIRIDDRYGFPEGRNEYRMTFSYLTWNEKSRQATFRSLNSVKFSYGR